MTVDKKRLAEVSAKAIATFGKQKELRKLQEEASEVSAAVNQFFDGRITQAELAGEMADNWLTLFHGRQIVGPEMFEAALEDSINKLERRIAEKK